MDKMEGATNRATAVERILVILLESVQSTVHVVRARCAVYPLSTALA